MSKVKGLPKFDSLEVAKIVNYPFEKRDYKPYAQARAAVNETTFFIDMWAFEVEPNANSQLVASLQFVAAQDENNAIQFDATVCAGGKTEFLMGKKAIEGGIVAAHLFTGEDLQGIFWGVSLEIPLDFLIAHGIKELEKGDIIRGNFYKVLEADKPHYGSLYVPAAEELLPHYKCYGNFEIIEY